MNDNDAHSTSIDALEVAETSSAIFDHAEIAFLALEEIAMHYADDVKPESVLNMVRMIAANAVCKLALSPLLRQVNIAACPWCGGHPTATCRWDMDGVPLHAFHCEHDGCARPHNAATTSKSEYLIFPDAIADWNKRADSDADAIKRSAKMFECK